MIILFVRWLETQQAEFERSSPDTWRIIRQAYKAIVSKNMKAIW